MSVSELHDREGAPEGIWRPLRQTIALPIYAVALLLDYLASGLGKLAAWTAGDDWPK